MSNDWITTRLRRANPVPATPALGDSALFARIVAKAGDPRLSNSRSARLSERKRRVLIAAIAAGVAALLASTAFAVSQLLGGDVVKPVVTRQEYFAAQKQLVLPPGATWPEFDMPESNSVTSRGAGGGRAVLVSMNAWECSAAATPRPAGRLTPSSTSSLQTTSLRLPQARRRIGRRHRFRRIPSLRSPTTVGWTGSATTMCRPPRDIPPALRRAAAPTASGGPAGRERAMQAGPLVWAPAGVR
jgi:hypothetical protein